MLLAMGWEPRAFLIIWHEASPIVWELEGCSLYWKGFTTILEYQQVENMRLSRAEMSRQQIQAAAKRHHTICLKGNCQFCLYQHLYK